MWKSKISAIEKKRLPCFSSLKPWSRPRLSFFETPAMLNGWAGKPCAENVALWNVRDGHRMDVAVRAFAEVGSVGLLGKLVPIAGEDALATGALERDAESTDAAKEVDEAELGSIGGIVDPVRWGRFFAQ